MVGFVSYAGSRAKILLDGSYTPSSVTVSLNGTTPVAIPGSWLRINGAVIASAGSSRVNAGDVVIRVAGGGSIISTIPAGMGIQRQAIYTVPAGHTLAIRRFLLSINRTSGTTINGHIDYRIRLANGTTLFPAGLGVSSIVDTDSISRPCLPIAEKTDIFLRIQALSESNVNLTAGFTGFLVDNAILAP